MPYLNVEEVESALTLAAAPPNTAFTQLITLPNLTWEGRQCHAIRLGNGSGPGLSGVYFLGGVHAREWGSPDILVNFVEQVSEAYRTNSGLSLGGKSFTAAQIQAIVNGLDIFIFPQANPDGRNFSMTSDAMWRKNRRPAPPGHPGCLGVDVNRNYNFLWNYPACFSPMAAVHNSMNHATTRYTLVQRRAQDPRRKMSFGSWTIIRRFAFLSIFTAMVKTFCIAGETMRIKQRIQI